MDHRSAVLRMAALLAQLLKERGISPWQLADEAGVNASVVHRTLRGSNARLSTWEKLFGGLGYRLEFDAFEVDEEVGDWLSDEAERRRAKCRAGLWMGGRPR